MTARPLEHEDEDDYCGTSHSSISVDGDDDEGERLLARQKSNRVGFERSYAKARNKLRCIYFLGSFAYSIYLPFFVLFMKNEIGLSAGEVGLVGALQIVGGYLVGPPVSLLVDWLSVKVDCLKFRIHKYMWIASMLASTIPVQLIPLANNFASALVIAIMVSGLNAPVSSIQDASTLGFLGKESHEYGKIRFWGAIGWGLGSLMGGSIAQFFGMQYAFRLFGVGTVANAAIVLSLDFTTIQKAEESSAAGSAGGGGSSSDSVPFHHSIRRLAPTWSYALCLFVAVVAGFGGSSLQSLLLIFLSDLGAPDFLRDWLCLWPPYPSCRYSGRAVTLSSVTAPLPFSAHHCWPSPSGRFWCPSSQTPGWFFRFSFCMASPSRAPGRQELRWPKKTVLLVSRRAGSPSSAFPSMGSGASLEPSLEASCTTWWVLGRCTESKQ